LKDLKIVVNGAGAAGIACLKLIESNGASRENIFLVDTNGLVYDGRIEGMNEFKQEFA
jgi:malate dehydrogenase (oxaloacetate-decarboxylating)(NADP+)